MFKIGQEVVCVRKDNSPFHQGLVINKVYTVLDTIYCSKCGTQNIHVGLYTPNKAHLVCFCDNRVLTIEQNGAIFHGAFRFKALDEMTKANTAVKELLKEVFEKVTI